VDVDVERIIVIIARRSRHIIARRTALSRASSSAYARMGVARV